MLVLASLLRTYVDVFVKSLKDHKTVLGRIHFYKEFADPDPLVMRSFAEVLAMKDIEYLNFLITDLKNL
jgi:hypothetical protein